MLSKKKIIPVAIGILLAVVSLVVFSTKPTVKAIWEPATLKFISGSSISDIQWMPDNKALSYTQGSVQFFFLEHKNWDSLPIGSRNTFYLDWNAQGNQLACAGWEAWIWNAQTQLAMPISDAEQYSFLNDVAWNPQGHELAILASGSSTEQDSLLIWDNEAKNLRSFKLSLDSNFRSIGWTPDGQIVVGFPRGDNPVEAWNALTGTRELPFLGNTITRLVYSPDGKTIATLQQPDHEFILWDAINQQQLTTLTNPFGALDSIKWSPDGKQIASNEHGNSTVHIWNVTSNQVGHTFNGNPTIRFTFEWNPTGEKIAIADYRGLHLWDVNSEKTQLFNLENAVNFVAWSPDGKLLACSTWDGIYIFDVTNT